MPSVPGAFKDPSSRHPNCCYGPTGVRGKTMLLRRLSERLCVECGAVEEGVHGEPFVAFYVNANDFADAFAHFPERPEANDEKLLTSYANLCVLADLLAVEFGQIRQTWY